MIVRPMLAADLKDTPRSSIHYPIYGSPKIDGIRCLKVNGEALSRSFKPIRNHYIRFLIESMELDNIDGELIVPGSFQGVQSAIMSEEGKPNFHYYIFDYFNDSLLYKPFAKRLDALHGQDLPEWASVLDQYLIQDVEWLLHWEKVFDLKCYEGIVLRDPMGLYKEGRSTLREGGMIKIKKFVDAEGIIMGFEEQLHNTNPQEENELGLSKRSHSKVGKVRAGTLGAFIVEDKKTGKTFKIGTGEGLTQQLRQEIWDNRIKYMGRIVKYKYQRHGTMTLPRIPLFLGFRDEEDMS